MGKPKAARVATRDADRKPPKARPSAAADAIAATTTTSTPTTRAAVVAAWAIVCSAAFVGAYWLFQRLHERTFAFSQLSTDERHMLLHSEQAWYMSFYWQSIEEPGMLGAMRAFGRLLRDGDTEYPHVINVLQRFNVAQEWALALGYRAVSLLWSSLDAYDFFMSALWSLQGLQLAALVLAGREATGHPLGAVAAVAAFLIDLKVMSRAHTNPLLRENFSLPFLWTQVALVCRALSRTRAEDAAAAPRLAGVLPTGGGSATAASAALGQTQVSRAAARAAAKQSAKAKQSSFASGSGGGGFSDRVVATAKRVGAELRYGWALCVSPVTGDPVYRGMAAATFGFALTWQFAPFALFLQVSCLLATHILGYMDAERLRRLCVTQLVAVLTTAVCMFGNLFYLTSIHLTLVVCILVMVNKGILAGRSAADAAAAAATETKSVGGPTLPARFTRAAAAGDYWYPVVESERQLGLLRRVWACARAACLTLGGAFVAKVALGVVFPSDSHVFSIFRAKLPGSEYRDFDTMMYECGGAYRVMPPWILEQLQTSTLAYRTGAVAVAIAVQVVVDMATSRRIARPCHVLLLLQGIAFSLIGVPIMRLMVFMMPSYALLSALLVAPEFWVRLVDSGRAALGLLHSGAEAAADSGDDAGASSGQSESKGAESNGGDSSTSGTKVAAQAKTAEHPRRRSGVQAAVALVATWLIAPAVLAAMYSAGRPQFEELVNMPQAGPRDLKNQEGLSYFFRNHTAETAVVAGSLPVSSTLKLLTGRRMAIHPHAEDAHMRLRYRAMYQVYPGFQEDTVYTAIAPLRANYLVISFQPCDMKCGGIGVGLDTVALAGTAEARAWAAREAPKLPARRREVVQRVVADDSYWSEDDPQGTSPKGEGKRDQFCFMATEMKLQHFKPVYQNDAHVVLQVL